MTRTASDTACRPGAPPRRTPRPATSASALPARSRPSIAAPMRTVSHRGASVLAPEKTLLAVQLAISHGVDFVEVDVHLSRDRQLVVHHDAAVVDRNGSRVPITTLSAAELARVPKGTGQSVPRLEDVLDLASGR